MVFSAFAVVLDSIVVVLRAEAVVVEKRERASVLAARLLLLL